MTQPTREPASPRPPASPAAAARPPATAARRRPPELVAAVLLMVPVGAVWAFLAVAWGVVMARTEGDTFLKVMLAVPISALCALVAFMSFVALRQAWRGTRNRLSVPAGFTFVLFAITLVRLVVERKLAFEPTMITPIVLGLMAGVALRLANTAAAQEWFSRS